MCGGTFRRYVVIIFIIYRRSNALENDIVIIVLYEHRAIVSYDLNINIVANIITYVADLTTVARNSLFEWGNSLR